MSNKFDVEERSEKGHDFLLNGIWDTCMFGKLAL